MENWFNPEDHSHTPAVWPVVDGAARVYSEVAEIVKVNFDQILILSTFNNALVEWAEKHFGKKSDDVEDHTCILSFVIGILKSMNIAVIIPTYNEIGHTEKMIDVVIKDVFPKIKNHKMMLLYVDSHSPDGTWKLVKDQMKKYPGKLFLLDEGGKFGLGSAYTHGFRYAIDKLKADGVMEMDSDFQHDPKDIPRFVREFEKGYDYILGTRYISGGSIPKEWGFDRKFLSIVGNLVYQASLVMWEIHDFTTGFRLARVKGFLDSMDFEKIFSKSFAYKTRLLYEMKKRGAKIKEIPINFGLRESGDSKMTNNTFTESLKVIAVIWADRLGLAQ